jgi:Ser/Thr protein kinase RdoA (MazF antagonist)
MSASLRVHGLDGSLDEPDWPPLTMQEIRGLVTGYPGLGKPLEILSVSPRPFSSACMVKTQNKNVFIKRHHRSVRDREGLIEEHRFLLHLHGHGASVPLVLTTATGDTAIEIGDWTYEVHDVAAGVDLYGGALSWTPFQTSAHARSAGAALARLHRAAHGFGAPPRKPRPLVASFSIFAATDPDDGLRHYLALRPILADHPHVRKCAEQALELLAPFHAELHPLLPALDPLWTHNDLHASNAFWSAAGAEAEVTALIDFGLSDRTNAVHDLAQAIERNIIEWLFLVEDPTQPDRLAVHYDHLFALLDGYEAIRPLSDREAAALAPMLALCHAEFALSESDYFLGVLRSEQKARMAYEGWLLGHARWFYSDSGTRLLNELRRWSRQRRQHRSRAERDL